MFFITYLFLCHGSCAAEFAFICYVHINEMINTVSFFAIFCRFAYGMYKNMVMCCGRGSIILPCGLRRYRTAHKRYR